MHRMSPDKQTIYAFITLSHYSITGKMDRIFKKALKYVNKYADEKIDKLVIQKQCEFLYYISESDDDYDEIFLYVYPEDKIKEFIIFLIKDTFNDKAYLISQFDSINQENLAHIYKKIIVPNQDLYAKYPKLDLFVNLIHHPAHPNTQHNHSTLKYIITHANPDTLCEVLVMIAAQNKMRIDESAKILKGSNLRYVFWCDWRG